MIDIRRYTDRDRPAWDDFVRRSNNGTFLFLRDYMDYHRDRFADYSLVVFRDGEIFSLLPAHRDGDTLASHAGLTYGGFITDDRMGSVRMLEVFEQAAAFARGQGVRTLLYKTVPHIYHRVPAEEDRYALCRLGATVAHREVLTAVRPRHRGPLQERRVRGIRKAETCGVDVRACTAFEAFWEILEWNLSTRHDAKPVHTIDEIRALHARFPHNIKLFGGFLGSALVAGTVIYESPTVAHAQYIASSERGRACRALDLVFHHLLTEVYPGKDFFDFGSSSRRDGRDINAGLVEFKEGFGARAVVHDTYVLEIEGTGNGQGGTGHGVG